MRYVVAPAFACLMVGAALAFHKWASAEIGSVIEQVRAKAGLAPGTNMNDFMIPLTRRQMLWMDLDHFLLKFWSVLLPLAFMLCFGIAALLPKGHAKLEPSNSSAQSP